LSVVSKEIRKCRTCCGIFVWVDQDACCFKAPLGA
jgi:hypothetical protein